VVNGSTSVMRSSLTVCLASTSAGRVLPIAQSTRSIGVDYAIDIGPGRAHPGRFLLLSAKGS
jgi:hypothetical protein